MRSSTVSAALQPALPAMLRSAPTGHVRNEVADTVSATAKAHTIHNFIRAVLWSVIGRKKKNNIARTRRVLIRSYTAVPFRFPDRMTGDVRSFCGPSHKALCR